MNSLYSWGINLILFLQGLGEWLIPPMKFFTLLGEEEFYLLVIPFLYWCIDSKVAIRTGLMLMLSVSVNNFTKWSFHEPRPYWISDKVKPWVSESSFGLPSGHAQNSVAIWGILAYSLKRKWMWMTALALMLLIGVSRLVLGVHFPQDTFLGWIIGLILLVFLIKIEPKVNNWMKIKTVPQKVYIYFLLALAMIFIGYLILLPLKDWTLPELWGNYIDTAFPGQEQINPLALSSQVTVGGVTFGLGLGYTLLFKGSGFNPKGMWWKRIARYLVGVIGVVIIWYGLDIIFPDGEALVPYIFRFVRYFLVGLWVTYLGPILFLRIKLASSSN